MTPGRQVRGEQAARLIGWLVTVGGSLAAVLTLWVQPMNPSLWWAMGVSVALCVVVGGGLLWISRRWSERPQR